VNGITGWVSSLHVFLIFLGPTLCWQHDAISDSLVSTRQSDLWKHPTILPHLLLCQCQGPSSHRNLQDQPDHYVNFFFFLIFLSLHSNFLLFLAMKCSGSTWRDADPVLPGS